ncbi:hypothetical protein LEP1GSC034_3889 [Leptospira interrogans str. 2003000735]|uniref:Uncharacterized protein n=8 Tax=Leptospira interrogans TaxID=173 RepID=A0A0E2D1U6_LEPIR|nr:hypothetical protein G436_3125 [Leptospira interrogans serovar Hardjo str. Norma]EJO78050.1 hypothetical protein LEP1GSC045_1578 [Leptospira interrogans serovar Pomona str. Kennewicki LC82-25]EJP04602.1 hypothetical protein LEP1GSC007_2493 [Leptospira interrogans serovar Bulgarica str. Mallika]EJP13056.1 hypothetical protein LEP1GSC080_0894 [Leptospira interrogans str. FPW2026]EKN89402.1 hypothetical protein LEP1GSC027_0502 [Leptospira interrogans str. 2002000624]EKN99244.1 hypothetical pro
MVIFYLDYFSDRSMEFNLEYEPIGLENSVQIKNLCEKFGKNKS